MSPSSADSTSVTERVCSAIGSTSREAAVMSMQVRCRAHHRGSRGRRTGTVRSWVSNKACGDPRPEKVELAHPTGVGCALATYDIPIEGRDEWLAVKGRGDECAARVDPGIPAIGPDNEAVLSRAIDSTGAEREDGIL